MLDSRSRMNGMTTEKIAMTIPGELLKKFRGSVRRGIVRGVSAHVSEALA